MTSNEAWDTIQAAFARIDEAPGPCRRRRRKTAEEEAAEFERVPDPPDLSFEFDEPPPRWTVQAGRRVRVVKGRPMMYLVAKVKAAAAKMTRQVNRALPDGWGARADACRVEVELVFPLKKGERVADAGALIPDTSAVDLDNWTKGFFDYGLVRGGVIQDDSQVTDYHITKHRGLHPRWAVRLWWTQGAGQLQFDV